MRRPAYGEVAAEARSGRRIRPNLFARIAAAALGGRLPVLLAWVVLASAGITYCCALTISLDLSGTGLATVDAQTAEAQRALDRAFPGTGEPIVAVIDSADPRAAREAAANLARAMRAERGSFRDVFAPGTSSFFDQYGVLYLDIAVVADMVRRIEQSAPLYRAIAASPDLAGLAALTAQAARAIAESRSPQGLNTLFREAALTVKGQIENSRHDLDWPSLLDHAASLESTRWYVLAVPVASEADDYRPAIRKAERLASEISSAAKIPVSVALTGRPVLAAGASASLANPLFLPALLAGPLVVIIVAFGLARPGLIVALLLALVLGFMTFAGGAALITPRIDRVTVAAPLVFFGPALLAMIAVLLRAAEHERAGMAPDAAMMLTAHRLGPTIGLWAIAIPAGALTVLLSPFASLTALALTTAVATATIFLAVLTLVPALLGFLPPHSGGAGVHWLDLLLDHPAPPVWRKLRRALVMLLLIAAILCIALVPQIAIDTGGEREEAGGRAAELFREIAAHEASLLASAHVVAKPGEEARRLAVRLAALPEVASARWIESFLPPGEAEKRQILARLAGALPKLPEQSTETEEDRLRTELSRLEQSLLDIANDPKTASDLKSAASEFRRSLALFDSPQPASADAVRRLENSLFVRLPLLLERVERLSSLPPLSFAGLDPEIVRHFVAADGSWRIEIIPRHATAVASFADAVRAVAPNAAGAAIVDITEPRLMRSDLGYAAAGILAMSFLAVLVAARSMLAGLRVIAPPLLLTLIAAGGMVRAGRSLYPEDIAIVMTALAMMVGAGLIAERWNGYASAWSREAPSVLPRALLVAELTFAAALAPLVISGERIFRDFGQLVALAAALEVLATFLIVPELMRWTRRRRQGISAR